MQYFDILNFLTLFMLKTIKRTLILWYASINLLQKVD